MDMYAEMDLAQDRGEDVAWSEQEVKKGLSYYTGVTKVGFSDPSKIGFKAWMSSQPKFVKDGQSKAQMKTTTSMRVCAR